MSTIHQCLEWFALAGLGVCALAAIGVLLCHCIDFARAFVRRFGVLGLLVALMSVFAAVTEGPPTNEDKDAMQDALDGESQTNAAFGALLLGSSSCGRAGGVNLLVAPSPASPASHRLVSVTTNENISYAMPSNAVCHAPWTLRGAAEDWTRVELGNAEWRFPFGTNDLSAVQVFTDGTIRPKLHSLSNQLVAVGSPMSAIPGVSRFWYAVGTNDSRILTWDTFAVGRIPLTSHTPHTPQTSQTSQTFLSAQIELRKSGDYIVRSNDVETAYRRVCPEDWDDDGIPNGDDVNPYFRDGDFFGPQQMLPDGANEGAYCWVEIAADVNAHVVFTGDGESDLPDPDFMIRAGETNRVALLIGKTYSVESSQPLTVTDRSSVAIEVGGNGSRDLTFVWPVDVYALEGNGASFMMRVIPDSIGGGFEWDDCCCPITGSGRVFSFSCNATCLCTGCTPGGVLVYEGYSVPVRGGHCGCSYGPRQVSTEPDDEQMVAGVSASFSPEAVIFEDTYTNKPGVVVYGRSTEAVLSCTVHGGFRGGTATFSFSGETNLVWIRGAAVPQSSVTIPPGEKLAFAAVYEGRRPSREMEDVTYTVTFAENGTTNVPSAVTAKLTSVKVELTAVYDAPENHNSSRHVYGVGEKIRFKIMPQSHEIKLKTEKFDAGDYNGEYELFDGIMSEADATMVREYVCPISANYHPPIRVKLGEVEHCPSIELVEPQTIVTREASWTFCHSMGAVGQSKLVTENFIGPMHVSFQGVMIAEIPCDEVIKPIGYFATSNFTGYSSHTMRGGAGYARRVQSLNRWTTDEAGGGLYSNWSPGRLEWKIPIGWSRVGRDEHEFATVERVARERFEDQNSRPLLIGGCTDKYKQVMTIDDEGTSRIEKFGHWLSRGRYCRIILDGVTKQWFHSL